jgi:hypothetical protein
MEFCCNKATTHNLGTILHFFNNPHTNTKGSADQNNRLVLYKKQYRKKKKKKYHRCSSTSFDEFDMDSELFLLLLPHLHQDAVKNKP